MNWTENGQVQSTSQNYTFTPTRERTLVANFTVAPTPTATATIRISASPAQVNEGDNVTFTISASSNTVRPVTISYSTSGKAMFGSDYTLSNGLGQNGQITIPLGADSVVVTLTAVADHAPEKNETVIMTLNTGAGYKLAKPKKAKVKILDAP